MAQQCTSAETTSANLSRRDITFKGAEVTVQYFEGGMPGGEGGGVNAVA